MLVMASQMQEQEVGDGTNWVIIFAGQLLDNAEELLRMGLSPTEVAEGYNLASKKASGILPGKNTNTRCRWVLKSFVNLEIKFSEPGKGTKNSQVV